MKCTIIQCHDCPLIPNIQFDFLGWGGIFVGIF